MEGDLLNSIEQVSRLLKEGVDESRRIHGDEFGFLGSVPMSIRKMQWEQEWSSDEAREEAYFSALRNWRLEELKKLQAFMQEQAAKPQIPLMDKRDARIAELEEEVKRLRGELNSRKEVEVQIQKQKASLEQDEKSKALIQSNTTDETIKNNIATQ
jgi:hypothetical protein